MTQSEGLLKTLQQRKIDDKSFLDHGIIIMFETERNWLKHGKVPTRCTISVGKYLIAEALTIQDAWDSTKIETTDAHEIIAVFDSFREKFPLSYQWAIHYFRFRYSIDRKDIIEFSYTVVPHKATMGGAGAYSSMISLRPNGTEKFIESLTKLRKSINGWFTETSRKYKPKTVKKAKKRGRPPKGSMLERRRRQEKLKREERREERLKSQQIEGSLDE